MGIISLHMRDLGVLHIEMAKINAAKLKFNYRKIQNCINV